METGYTRRIGVSVKISPHSLGKLIEWKRLIANAELQINNSCPHSLGKLIEWKLQRKATKHVPDLLSPLAGETN